MREIGDATSVEPRYRAAGRIRLAAPIARPAGLEWFLPGAGKDEGFQDAEFAPEMVIVAGRRILDGLEGRRRR